jgi:nucleotide-binding universal stress UspA family protein
MSTIVIGITHHASALAACNLAFEWTKPDDQLHLVYAIDGSQPSEVATARRHADGLLESLQLSSSRAITVHTVNDRPHRAILATAKQTKADLIVIGNRGLVRHRRFTNAVPSRVLRAAKCSVLVVDTTPSA